MPSDETSKRDNAVTQAQEQLQRAGAADASTDRIEALVLLADAWLRLADYFPKPSER